MKRPAALCVAALPLSGCGEIQTVLGGQGEHSAQFVSLFHIFLGVTALFYLLVVGFLGAAILRRRRRSAEDSNVVEAGRHHHSSKGVNMALAGWAALVVVGLAGLTIASFLFDRAHAEPQDQEPINIRITAHQFWWDVQYEGDLPSLTVRTANELYLPLGRRAHIRLESNDVIHSLWIPNLAGKQDLIPGRTTDLDLLPRKAGQYRGRCAEFCGVQHAHMALDVTVIDGESFKRWYAAQLRPAAPPRNALAQFGQAYVTSRECAMCHNINGTPASGRIGPDLTHVASRRSIAAGTLPMTRGNLYGWIADPQAQKPGNHMPTLGLEPQELHGIVAYLEGLK